MVLKFWWPSGHEFESDRPYLFDKIKHKVVWVYASFKLKEFSFEEIC